MDTFFETKKKLPLELAIVLLVITMFGYLIYLNSGSFYETFFAVVFFSLIVVYRYVKVFRRKWWVQVSDTYIECYDSIAKKQTVRYKFSEIKRIQICTGGVVLFFKHGSFNRISIGSSLMEDLKGFKFLVQEKWDLYQEAEKRKGSGEGFRPIK